MVNYAYWICKKLREDNIDVELLMNSKTDHTSDPLKYDPSLNNRYPSWIQFYDTRKLLWKKKVIDVMKKKEFELIHAYVELPIFAYLSGRKFIANPQGSDLREMAFSNSFRGILLRRAYKKAKAIIIAGVEGFSLLSKLNLNNGVFIPAFVDFSKFHPEKIKRDKFTDKFVIFHPSHQIWNQKGNHILIKGFKKFVEQYPNSVLIIVNHGPDSEKTTSLIRELNLEKHVEFLDGPLNTHELKKMYSTSDIIADQFIIGELGGIGREVLGMQKPLLTYCWLNKFKELLSEAPPIANASSPEQITEQLILLSDKKIREKLAKEGYNWLHKYYNPDVISKKITILYQEILNGEKIENIKSKISCT